MQNNNDYNVYGKYISLAVKNAINKVTRTDMNRTPSELIFTYQWLHIHLDRSNEKYVYDFLLVINCELLLYIALFPGYNSAKTKIKRLNLVWAASSSSNLSTNRWDIALLYTENQLIVLLQSFCHNTRTLQMDDNDDDRQQTTYYDNYCRTL